MAITFDNITAFKKKVELSMRHVNDGDIPVFLRWQSYWSLYRRWSLLVERFPTIFWQSSNLSISIIHNSANVETMPGSYGRSLSQMVLFLTPLRRWSFLSWARVINWSPTSRRESVVSFWAMQRETFLSLLKKRSPLPFLWVGRLIYRC